MSLSTLQAYWRRRRSIWPLVTFRVLFGLVAAFGAARFMAEGWVETLIVDAPFAFRFWGFAWVAEPGIFGAYALYATILSSALAVAAGWRFRWTAPLFVLCFAYAELLDATHYLNHHYLVVLLGGLLCLTPAHAAASLDVRAGRVKPSDSAPAWCTHALMLQLALVYVFAGLAKVNPDWLLRAMPLAIWLPEHQGWPVVGPLLAEPWVAYAASWAGCIYDLTIVGWLLWPRTRVWAYAVVLLFHGLTWSLFNIGLFPLIMSTATLIFFSPAVHEGFWRKLTSRFGRESLRWREAAPEAGGTQTVHSPEHWGRTSRWRQALLPSGLALYFLVQVGLPLRTHLYPGPAVWGEEGYRFGWRVMLAEKVGHARFTVVAPGGSRRLEVDNRDYLTDYQIKQMAIQPDFVLQFARHLAREFGGELAGASESAQSELPAVYADVWVSLNGRRSRRLVDPTVDLASVRDGLSPKPWILPLDE